MREYKIKFPSGYQGVDLHNDNVDVNLIFPDGKVYFATLFTLENISSLMNKENSSFFWASDMVILKDLKQETIYKALDELIEKDYLSLILSELGTIEKIYSFKKYDEI